jgi:hypothetical protein
VPESAGNSPPTNPAWAIFISGFCSTYNERLISMDFALSIIEIIYSKLLTPVALQNRQQSNRIASCIIFVTQSKGGALDNR